MITEEELRGEVAHGLRGVKRGVNDTPEHRAARARHKKWRSVPANAEAHREYNAAYQKDNRAVNNAAVDRFKTANPERRKAQLRAAARRYERKKRAQLAQTRGE